MSFVERNKIWLLPLLGVGVLGVIWMNVQTFKPRKAPAPSPAAPGPAPAPAPEAAPPVPTLPAPAPPPGSASDLWADLRLLETPAPALNQLDALLKEGSCPLEMSHLGSVPEPELEPASWQRLPEPHFAKAVVSAGAPRVEAPPLKLELILEAPGGLREAWFAGRPYRTGQSPDGVHRIKQIHRWSVVLSGPSGDTRLSTELGREASAPKRDASNVSAEAL